MQHAGLTVPLSPDWSRAHGNRSPRSPGFGARPSMGARGLSTQFEAPVKNTIGRSHFLQSHGRPPWYGEDGQPISDAFVIGIAGGSSSGKTYVAKKIVESLGSIPTVVILSQDSFYKRHGPDQLKLAFANKYDFDHPDALDMPVFAACLADLKANKQTNIPIYSFAQHQRLDETKYLYGATIIIAEGIMALLDPELRKLYDLKIFVQSDSDLMLARRIKRDTKERGRTVDGILEQYLRFVKPAYDNFVQPTSRHADIIVPGSGNDVAIDLISTHIRQQLAERSSVFRDRLACVGPEGILSPSISSKPIDSHRNLILIPQTPQLQGIYTILRDQSTSRQDWIFFIDRLSTFLGEKALEHVPYRQKTVVTPVEAEVKGKEIAASCLCAVSILRAGGLLEKGFRRVLNNIPIGSLLIQSSDAHNGEPLLLHNMLPACIRDRSQAEGAWVFVLDAQIGTGASAFMAIRVLLDHGVPENQIIFVTILVARTGGLAVLERAFPQVKVVAGAVDENVEERWLSSHVDSEDEPLSADASKYWVITPGMGQLGDRYYL